MKGNRKQPMTELELRFRDRYRRLLLDLWPEEGSKAAVARRVGVFPGEVTGILEKGKGPTLRMIGLACERMGFAVQYFYDDWDGGAEGWNAFRDGQAEWRALRAREAVSAVNGGSDQGEAGCMSSFATH